jgi:hypothetical protein
MSPAACACAHTSVPIVVPCACARSRRAACSPPHDGVHAATPMLCFPSSPVTPCELALKAPSCPFCYEQFGLCTRSTWPCAWTAHFGRGRSGHDICLTIGSVPAAPSAMWAPSPGPGAASLTWFGDAGSNSAYIAVRRSRNPPLPNYGAAMLAIRSALQAAEVASCSVLSPGQWCQPQLWPCELRLPRMLPPGGPCALLGALPARIACPGACCHQQPGALAPRPTFS